MRDVSVLSMMLSVILVMASTGMGCTGFEFVGRLYPLTHTVKCELEMAALKSPTGRSAADRLPSWGEVYPEHSTASHYHQFWFNNK